MLSRNKHLFFMRGAYIRPAVVVNKNNRFYNVCVSNGHLLDKTHKSVSHYDYNSHDDKRRLLPYKVQQTKLSTQPKVQILNVKRTQVCDNNQNIPNQRSFTLSETHSRTKATSTETFQVDTKIKEKASGIKTSSNVLEEEDVFGDHVRVYSSKSTWELFRTSAFFMMCRFQYLTSNAEKLMLLSKTLLGTRLSQALVRHTIYAQFVAGSSPAEIAEVVDALGQQGVGALMALPMEDDAGVAAGSSSKEQLFDDQLEKLVDCVGLCRTVGGDNPMFQLKGTALMSGNLTRTISDLCSLDIDSRVLEAVVRGMDGEEVDFSKLPGWASFSQEQSQELRRALQRFKVVNETVLKHDVVAMMDAEYTYLNPCLRLLSLAMACICSKDRPRVFYTYQANLKNTVSQLRDDITWAEGRGVCFGAKLVRGAYMVTERRLAQRHGYDDPVCPDFPATSASYHACLDMLLDRAAHAPSHVGFIVASHNEDTVKYAMDRMRSLGLAADSPSVFFGQLYGMADHVSFTLGHHGYRVYKSLPYGAVDETVPYLARRAQENTAVLANARRERGMVNTALWGRLRGRV